MFGAFSENEIKMTEAEYWPSLERRLGREFAGMAEHRHRHFWCDGFKPAALHLDGASPRIGGTVWIANGSEQHEWAFVLLLPRSVRSRDEIDWASLLPAENMTRWVSFDEDTRTIEIDLAKAEPDPA